MKDEENPYLYCTVRYYSYRGYTVVTVNNFHKEAGMVRYDFYPVDDSEGRYRNLIESCDGTPCLYGRSEVEARQNGFANIDRILEGESE